LIHHFEPQTWRQLVECHHPASPWKNKIKATSSTGKVMATDFLGCRRGDFGRCYAMCVQTINPDLYIQSLKTLQKHFRRVWLHNNFVKILLQYTSAWSQKSLKTQEAIIKLRWTVLPHAPYRPDLIPSDFLLFWALRGALHGKKFGNVDKVIEEVTKWLLNAKFSLVQEDNNRCCCFWLVQDLLLLVEIVWKNEVCNTSNEFVQGIIQYITGIKQ
jgi:hypothetical protein